MNITNPNHIKMILDKEKPITERLGFILSIHSDLGGANGAAISVRQWDKAIEDIIEVFGKETNNQLAQVAADVIMKLEAQQAALVDWLTMEKEKSHFEMPIQIYRKVLFHIETTQPPNIDQEKRLRLEVEKLEAEKKELETDTGLLLIMVEQLLEADHPLKKLSTYTKLINQLDYQIKQNNGKTTREST